MTTKRNSHLVLNWVPSPHVTLQPLRGDQADQPPCTTSQEKHLFKLKCLGWQAQLHKRNIFEFGLVSKTPCLAVVEVVWEWCFAQQAAPQRAVGLVAKAESQTPSFGQSCCKIWHFWAKNEDLSQFLPPSSLTGFSFGQQTSGRRPENPQTEPRRYRITWAK